MAEITADRDAIENARLILLEEHEELKAEAVFYIFFRDLL